jgi:hypothetical protein
MMIGCVKAHGRVSPSRCLSHEVRSKGAKVTPVYFTPKKTSPEVPSTVDAPDHTRAVKARSFIIKLFDLACELDPLRKHSSSDLLLRMKRASEYQKSKLRWYCFAQKELPLSTPPNQTLEYKCGSKQYTWLTVTNTKKLQQSSQVLTSYSDAVELPRELLLPLLFFRKRTFFEAAKTRQ